MRVKKSKLLLKIMAGLVAFVLIGVILFMTNAFVGNPVSAMIAKKAIQQYVEQNYSFLDLEVGKSEYNFKFSSYGALAKSKTSQDTWFYIYYRNGEVYHDDYEANVIKKANTLNRFADEYSLIAKKLIAKELGYENNRTFVHYDADAYEKAQEVLQLDMPFSHKLPLHAVVTLRFDLTDSSLEHVANVLIDAHKAFINNDYHFFQYSYYGENDDELVMVDGVTPAHIESGQLLDVLKRAESSDDGYDGIFVMIRTIENE